MPNRFPLFRSAIACTAAWALVLSGCNDAKPDAKPTQPTGTIQLPQTAATTPQPATGTPLVPPPPVTPTAPAPTAAGSAPVLPQKAEDIHPLLTGAELPAITLLDADKKTFDLNAAVKTKPTVLIFFRGGWCPYCNRHLQALEQIEADLVQLGYQIIAVTADKPELLPADEENNGLKYDLYSDGDMAAAKSLGIAFRLDDATVEKYKGYKIDLERDTGRSDQVLPVPAAYVLTTEAKIAYEYINPDYRVRADTDVLVAAAKAALKSPQGKPTR